MKLEWPKDAVMIVAATPAEVHVDRMTGTPQDGVCRDCGAKVTYDSYTFGRASEMPARHGRPVLFFCTACAVRYDFKSITHFEDHRRLNQS